MPAFREHALNKRDRVLSRYEDELTEGFASVRTSEIRLAALEPRQHLCIVGGWLQS
jgi:hypothetical protein